MATVHPAPVSQPQPSPVQAWAVVLRSIGISASALGDCDLARAMDAS